MCAKILEKRPGCIQQTLDIIGDKWTALILRDLTAADATFGQLERSLVGISPRTLSQRLDKLETCGIVTRHLYCERPPRYQYRLSEKGSELRDVLDKMADWGAKYLAEQC